VGWFERERTNGDCSGSDAKASYRMPRVSPRLTANARDLRRNATRQERKIWRLLSYHRPRFTRQHVVGPYILDLACRQAKLAVEFDGSQHIDATDYDSRRTAFLESLGWRVIRFWNSEVMENPEGVAEAILLELGATLQDTHP
jgi:very-short-patch-repair endonuclease